MLLLLLLLPSFPPAPPPPLPLLLLLFLLLLLLPLLALLLLVLVLLLLLLLFLLHLLLHLQSLNILTDIAAWCTALTQRYIVQLKLIKTNLFLFAVCSGDHVSWSKPRPVQPALVRLLYRGRGVSDHAARVPWSLETRAGLYSRWRSLPAAAIGAERGSQVSL